MSVRRYRCENRGLVIDRDENSAVNIYQRSLHGRATHSQEYAACCVNSEAITTL
jgi:transposase